MTAKKVGSVMITDEMMQRAMAANAEGANYTGAGDNFVDFGSAKTFLYENQTGKRVTITLDNTKGTEDRMVQFNKIIAEIEDAILLKDGEAATGLNISCTPCKAAVLADYMHLCPSRIQSIKFAASAAAQLDEPFRSYKVNPFTKNPIEEERIPSNYQSQNTNNPLMVDVEDLNGYQLSALQTATYKVPAGVKVSLTILFGGTLDIAGALAKKADDAALTVASAYVASEQ